jgi:hypothetical protein
MATSAIPLGSAVTWRQEKATITLAGVVRSWFILTRSFVFHQEQGFGKC